MKSNVDQPLPTTLKIVSIPVDCDISIEGPATGMKRKTEPSSVFSNLPPGNYTVRVTRASGSLEKTIDLAACMPITLTANFFDNAISKHESNTTIPLFKEQGTLESWGNDKLGRYSSRIGERWRYDRKVGGFHEAIRHTEYELVNFIARIKILVEKQKTKYGSSQHRITHAWVVESVDPTFPI